MADRTSRRSVMRGALGLTAAALTPGALWATVKAGAPSGLTSAQTEFADQLCDAVIPATDTPGARAVGVTDFVGLALSHGLAGGSPTSLDRVKAALGTGDFAAALTRLDKAAFANEIPEAKDWKAIKQAILMGYYTSETGASKELRYELVPGRFDSDIPWHKGDRAWSSNWGGNSF